MAGKKKAPQFDPDVESVDIEDPRTMAYKLEHPEEIPDVDAVFEGTGSEEETAEEKAAREAAEAEAAAKAAAEAAAQGGETEEQKAEREAAEKEAAEKAAAEAAAKPPEYKYKSQGEAEAAEKEAERKMHEATTKAAEEVKAREAAEKEREDLKQQLAELEKKPESKPEAISPEERRKKIVGIRAAALQKMWALDRSDPEYANQTAEILAEADEALLELGVKPAVREDEIDKLIDQKISAKEQAKEQAKAAAQQEQDKEAARQRAWDDAVERARKAGLRMDDPDVGDYDLFYMASGRIPQALKDEGNFGKMVDWAIQEVNRKNGKVVEQTDEERKRALEEQKKNMVLGKGIPKQTPKEPPKKRTMMEMFDQISP